MRVILFCLVLPFLGTYSVPTDNVCIKQCEINYNSCIENGALKSSCLTIYKRCLRRCDKKKV